MPQDVVDSVAPACADFPTESALERRMPRWYIRRVYPRILDNILALPPMDDTHMLNILVPPHEGPFVNVFLLGTGCQVADPERARDVQRLLVPLPLVPVPQLFAAEGAEISCRFAQVGHERLVFCLLGFGIEASALAGAAVAGARV